MAIQRHADVSDGLSFYSLLIAHCFLSFFLLLIVYLAAIPSWRGVGLWIGETLMRRLHEFKATPSAQLTLEQFYKLDADSSNVAFDPPAYIRNQLAASAKGVRMSLVAHGGATSGIVSQEHGDMDEGDSAGEWVSGGRAQRLVIGDVEVEVPVPTAHK